MQSKYNNLEENILRALKEQEAANHLSGLREIKANPEAKKAEQELLQEARSPFADVSFGIPTQTSMREKKDRQEQFNLAIEQEDKKQGVLFENLVEKLIACTGCELEELYVNFHMLEREGLIESTTDAEDSLNGYSITAKGLIALRNI